MHIVAELAARVNTFPLARAVEGGAIDYRRGGLYLRAVTGAYHLSGHASRPNICAVCSAPARAVVNSTVFLRGDG